VYFVQLSIWVFMIALRKVVSVSLFSLRHRDYLYVDCRLVPEL
jgi:hypothetical protein